MANERAISIAKSSLPYSPPRISAQESSPPPFLRFVSGEGHSLLDIPPSHTDHLVDASELQISDPPIDGSDPDRGITAFTDEPHHGVELSEALALFGLPAMETPLRSSRNTDQELQSMHKQNTARAGGAFNPRLAEVEGVTPQNSSGGLPSASGGVLPELARKVSFAVRGSGERNLLDRDSTYKSPAQAQPSPSSENPPQTAGPKRKFSSPPMLVTDRSRGRLRAKARSVSSGAVRTLAQDNEEDFARGENYFMFRTRSYKFEKQRSRKLFQGSQGGGDQPTSSATSFSDVDKPLPAGRYFDALRGPELEFVKKSEELLLPLNRKWPFLLRYPIGCFGVCLGLSSQAMLYKLLATSASTRFLHIPLAVNFALWCLALISLVIVSITYGLKCLLYFEAVRREYYHPVRVNFFFAPWITGMLLTLASPPQIGKSINPAVWCVLTTPLLLLKLKIYGQWVLGGQRRFSKVANPSTHLAVAGSFVSAMLAAMVGWDEAAIAFWAVGCAHYLVLFVTLYQRLPTAEVLPKELHPVFFLFVATPSAASVAWKNISGSFDRVSRVAYFLALFLYLSLVLRVKFFRGFRFSITWWAYTFPMTASAIATINYSMEVRHPITQGMSVLLSCISSVVVITVFVATVYHALVDSLFPNDVAIAIRRQHRRKQKGAKIEPLPEKMWKEHMDDSTKLFMESGDRTTVASLKNGLIRVASDPCPACARATQTSTAQEA